MERWNGSGLLQLNYMSSNIVLYCKSYRNDLPRVKILLDSVKRNNVDNIPFYISAPDTDVELFQSELGVGGYTMVYDGGIVDIPSDVPGWIGQQVIKSSFWKLGLCENYVMIDSDSYFIRPFRVSDFMYENVPYTVMHEQHDLFSWTCNKTKQLGFDPQQSFAECRLKVMDLFDRTGGRLYDFGPSPVIWSAAVWRSLEDDYLKPAGATLTTAITKVQSEFTWYGEWLLATRPIPLLPIEPLFRVFHYQSQYAESKNQGVTESDLSRVYMGVVMQSNWNAPLKY